MITPDILFISKEEFDRLVLDAEAKFMRERANQKPEERERCVRMWLDIPHSAVPENYLHDLKKSYKDAGWNIVKVEYQKDRTEKIYIYLSM